ncbi:MAG: hypothetical protein E7644_03490 [Ruminococcaceae bacterium]|nr:hypothetical protein [Oscillospiraceae bacterium]
MTDKLIDRIRKEYPLHELPTGEFATLKAGGMKFTVAAYCAEGLGHVSVMRAKGFFGLMKMDTLMIVPREKDLPLYSYDRIYAMGNDTLIVELYDTLIEKPDLSALDAAKEGFARLPERDAGEHWYDAIKLKESISKKAKKTQSADLDALTVAHFDAYLSVTAATVADKAAKKALSARYVDGLLSRGGPSTDVFKKTLGEEQTAKLFRQVLFGTDVE